MVNINSKEGTLEYLFPYSAANDYGITIIIKKEYMVENNLLISTSTFTFFNNYSLIYLANTILIQKMISLHSLRPLKLS